MNKVVLIGRVGRDAEVHMFEGGSCVISWSMATNERYKDKSGEWTDKTTWHECKKFAKSDGLASCIQKGDMLGVDGSVTLEEWGDGDGKKSRTVIKVWDVDLLGGKKEQGQKPSTGGGYNDDSIPF